MNDFFFKFQDSHREYLLKLSNKAIKNVLDISKILNYLNLQMKMN